MVMQLLLLKKTVLSCCIEYNSNSSPSRVLGGRKGQSQTDPTNFTFIYSFIAYILSGHYVPEAVLGIGDVGCERHKQHNILLLRNSRSNQRA